MGVQESLDISMLIMQFLLFTIALITMSVGVVTTMFSAGAMYSSSVRAGLIAGCMSVNDLYEGTTIEISEWNLLPVDIAVTKNAVIASLEKIGWVAFPGMILEPPTLKNPGETGITIFVPDGIEGWIVNGHAIDTITMFHNQTGKGVILG